MVLDRIYGVGKRDARRLGKRRSDLTLGESRARASAQILKTLEIEDPAQLLGLYHGINLTRKSVLDVPMNPDEVILYREPIIAYSEHEGLPLAEVVNHVLIHEIGHHFGYSDEDMERLQST